MSLSSGAILVYILIYEDPVRFLTAILAVFFLGFGAYQAVRIALADGFYQDNSLDSTRTAVRLEPLNASYHALLAEHLESTGKNSAAELQTASQLSPYDARFLNRLGFRAEVEQDYGAAVSLLLRAAQVDRGFRPRWALMNFYFRRNQDKDFWEWAKRTLARSYGDLTPVFRLCWAAPASEDSVIEHVLPPDPDVHLRYLEYLNAEQEPPAAKRMALLVAQETNERSGVDAALAFCNRVLQTDPAAAISVWNMLCRRKLLPHESLDPTAGPVITNGTFGSKPTGKGFDWRIRSFDGMRVNSGPDTGLVLRFDGSQPEIFDVMEQPIPLVPGHRYQLTFTYQLAPETVNSGLHWRLDGTSAGLIAASSVLKGAGLQEDTLTFTAGGERLAFLRLGFSRATGTVRWSGTATIRQVAIQPLP